MSCFTPGSSLVDAAANTLRRNARALWCLRIPISELNATSHEGSGAGFISWVLIKAVRGKMAEIHWLMWVVAIAFLVFFAQDWITGLAG